MAYLLPGNRPVQQTYHCGGYTNLPVDVTGEQDPKKLKVLYLRQVLLLTRRRQSPFSRVSVQINVGIMMFKGHYLKPVRRKLLCIHIDSLFSLLPSLRQSHCEININ